MDSSFPLAVIVFLRHTSWRLQTIVSSPFFFQKILFHNQLHYPILTRYVFSSQTILYSFADGYLLTWTIQHHQVFTSNHSSLQRIVNTLSREVSDPWALTASLQSVDTRTRKLEIEKTQILVFIISSKFSPCQTLAASSHPFWL